MGGRIVAGMRALSALLADQAQILHNAVATLPAPSGAPASELLAGWRSGSAGPRGTLVQLDASAAVTIPGPVDFVAWDPVRAKWYRTATADDGADVDLTADVGLAVELYDVPAWATHLQVVAGGALVGAGLVTVTATPLEISEDS